MQFLKNYFIHSWAIILFALLQTHLFHAISVKDLDQFIFKDSFVFNDLGEFDELENAYLSIPEIPRPMKRQPAQDIILALLEIKAIDILDQSFFLRTNQLVQRSLLDLPVFEIHNCCLPECETIFDTYLFYNVTTRSNFKRKSTDICSYLALNQQTLIDALQTTVNIIRNNFQIEQLNIGKILGLIKNLTVQQRRLGGMFHAMRRFERYEFRAMLPFYYMERNYFLRNHEISAIEQQFGSSGNQQDDSFQRKHLVSDKLGFGDSRVEFDARIADDPRFIIRLGLMTTLPTARTVKSGLYGSSFNGKADLPLLDLEQLFLMAQDPTPAVQQAAFDIVQNYVLGAVDRLSANLLDTPLGNGGHMSLGVLLRTETPLASYLKRWWTEFIFLDSRISLEYLFPHFETRSYILRNSINDFMVHDFTNRAMADQNLIFIETELSRKINLLALETRIQPGPIFRWTSKGCYLTSNWQIIFGTDMWIQFKESQHRINTFRLALRALDKRAAQNPFAYQAKLFGGIQYAIERDNYRIQIGLDADSTYTSSGIGRDSTCCLTVEAFL